MLEEMRTFIDIKRLTDLHECITIDININIVGEKLFEIFKKFTFSG